LQPADRPRGMVETIGTSYTRLIDMLERLLKAVVVMILAVLGAILFSQVFTRYVLSFSVSWSEELSRYLLVWLSLLGASMAFRKREHIAVQLANYYLGARANHVINLFVDLMIMTFAWTLIKYGRMLVEQNMAQYSWAVPWLPIGMIYSALPVSGWLTLLIVLERLFADLQLFVRGE
jgi:TRAP-type C4-dicarboxylate transport system permease small subunit